MMSFLAGMYFFSGCGIANGKNALQEGGCAFGQSLSKKGTATKSFGWRQSRSPATVVREESGDLLLWIAR
ncbi:MAG: hypothetical protein LBJ38_03045 [Oscillospiraceae bacterium]|nr:hypothetical protein [Oscillospiraceae bacterium]